MRRTPLVKRYRLPSSPTTWPGSITPRMPRSIGSDHGPLIASAWITKIDASVSVDHGVGMNGM